MFRTARWRLVAWNVSVLSLILLVLGFAVYRAFSGNIYKEVDQELSSQELRELVFLRNYSTAAIGNIPFDPAGTTTIVANTQKQVQWPSCQEQFIGTPCQTVEPVSATGMQAVLDQWHRGPVSGATSFIPADVRTVSTGGLRLRVRTFMVFGVTGPYVVQISRNVAPERRMLEEVGTLLLYGSLFGIVLAAGGSLFLANRALVPIRHAFHRQRQFTADASHELRTPLALIRANAEMLERYADRLPERDSDLVNEIIHETDHLNRLVGDLLTLARADAGSLTLVRKTVDLRELVAEVHDDVFRIAESRGIESKLTLNGPVQVEGDQVRLRQLMLILLDNALKYTDSGGRVGMSLEQVGGHARVVVSDTGIGIPAADLPHIFERFYRVDRAREHESGGTGLGLAIAQWIVQAHNGSIKVESSPQRGTRFQVELPASTS
ncbi:MAG: hypothetical protein NVSMB22_17380 [Chloroflexota bacterium]